MEENIAMTDTTPEEQQTDVDTEETPETTPEEEETTEQSAATEASVEQEATPITIPIKYNSKYRELSVEEAATLAQKGLKFDSLSPMLEKINYLAAASGKTASQVIDDLYSANEKSLRESLLEKANYDEELANQLMELEHSKREKAYNAVLEAQKNAEAQEQEDINTRLAAEFSDIQAEFPQYKEFGDLPKSIVDNAVKKNISLFDALLRFNHSESKKQTAAATAQKKADNSTAGSQQATEADVQDGVTDAMLKGLYGKS